MPILALYLVDKFQAGEFVIGFILACYTISALSYRPFAGFLVDKLDRKKLYIISLSIFVLSFGGYPIAGSLWAFIAFRTLHGISFGSLTVTANTLVIDISPKSRRGEALGIFGIANTTAMAVGPMVAVQLKEAYGYNAVFYIAFILGIIAFTIGSTVKSSPKPKHEHAPLSWDRFILFKGIPPGFNLFLMGIPYGMITSYIALYSVELGLGEKTGWFYSLFAVGIILSRIFSGKQTDRGKLTQVISMGIGIATLALIILSSSKLVESSPTTASLLFNGAALFVGLGYGSIFPAMNNLFVNLAPHNKRGTANSTYMTTWDIGVGLGLVFSGKIGATTSYSIVFLIGAIAAITSVIVFEAYTKHFYHRNKIVQE